MRRFENDTFESVFFKSVEIESVVVSAHPLYDYLVLPYKANLPFFCTDSRNITDLATGDGKHKPTNFLTSLLRFHFERIRKSLLVTLSN